jgi:hypothetical protein
VVAGSRRSVLSRDVAPTCKRIRMWFARCRQAQVAACLEVLEQHLPRNGARRCSAIDPLERLLIGAAPNLTSSGHADERGLIFASSLPETTSPFTKLVEKSAPWTGSSS